MSKVFDFFPLTIKEVRVETDEASTLVFEIPADLKETFRYRPGQYLTLRIHLEGEEYRRAYSMCSSPLETGLAVTVKRVPKGKISNYLNDTAKAGQSIEVMPPQGRFTPSLSPEQRMTYYLFGAGSGITPLLSILKTILEEEPQSMVYLLYGNRSEDTILFRDELDQLEKRYEGQLKVEHTLSRPSSDKPRGLAGLFSKGNTGWTGKKGRIDAGAVKKFLGENPATTKQSLFFICGPGKMIDTVTDTLSSTEMIMPDAIDDAAPCENIIAMCDPVGQGRAAGGFGRIRRDFESCRSVLHDRNGTWPDDLTRLVDLPSGQHMHGFRRCDRGRKPGFAVAHGDGDRMPHGINAGGFRQAGKFGAGRELGDVRGDRKGFFR